MRGDVAPAPRAPRRRPALAVSVLLVVALVAYAGTQAARAGEPLAPPEGPVVLLVSGDVACANTDRGAAFDLEMVEALGMRHLRTTTPWTTGIRAFEGVLLRDVLRAACARGDTLVARAWNDYQVSIPVADVQGRDVLLALRMDGRRLTLRDKGPSWIVYPASGDGHTRTEQDRMVWQLLELRVE